MSARRDPAVVITGRDGSEARISLHPLSLALVLAEVIEDAARGRCRRKGHAAPESPNGPEFSYCSRCGASLPDTDDTPAFAWFPPLYRSFVGGGDR